jgi:tetratricopeptide (TPR) repeat protein
MLGKIYVAQNNKLAVDYLNGALNIEPQSVEALYTLALYLQEHNEFLRAKEMYLNIIHLSPKYKYAYYNLGYINLIYLKNYTDAVKNFSNAIACDPYFVEAYYNRGYSYEMLKDFNNAKNDYKKALKLKTNYEKAIKALNRIE